MTDDLTAETITIDGHGGERIEAYLVRPTGVARRGSIVQVHHILGWDRWSKEITRRLAVLGYDAICPNLFSREGFGAAPDDAAAAARAKGGVSDDQVVGDIASAVAVLRGLPSANGKVGAIGHCSGGRHAVLAGCRLPVDAVVDCYGAYVIGDPPADRSLSRSNLLGDLPNLRAPVLGLFGNDDSAPTPAQVDELEQILQSQNTSAEFHRYDSAGHAFFATDRPSYRVEAAVDGWEHIARFLTEQLAA